jgi:uncharacterized protein (TIGR03435 family)
MKLLFFTALFLAVPVFAQVFEVASVKPAAPFVPGAQYGMRGGPGTDDPTRLAWPRATLPLLLMQAYAVSIDQISGPLWISDGAQYCYDINATIPPGATRDQFRVMLQHLLADRFHLKLHHQSQSRPGYELTVAPGGAKLKPWTPTAKPSPTASINMNMSGHPYPVQLTLHGSITDFCRSLGADINMSNGEPMNGSQPRVVDKTGLTGAYEFTLRFAGAWIATGAPLPDPAASEPVDLPNIFVAVEKQLGLKLTKLKDVPVDVLVIDAVDKVPTAN